MELVALAISMGRSGLFAGKWVKVGTKLGQSVKDIVRRPRPASAMRLQAFDVGLLPTPLMLYVAAVVGAILILWLWRGR